MQYTVKAGLFGEQKITHSITKPHPDFVKAVDQFYKIKGEATGRYTQRKINESLVADIFMCTADNWGYILALRTGSKDYSHKILGSRWVSKGYHGTDGMLYKNGQPVKVKEEQDLFKLCGLKFIEPKFRKI